MVALIPKKGRIVSRVFIMVSIVCLMIASPVTALSESVSAATVSTPTTNQRLAKHLLGLWRSGDIGIANYSENRAGDLKDRSLASVQLMDIARTGRAHLSTRCTNRGGHSMVTPDTRVLSFLVIAARSHNYTITTLFGQCHKTGSAHYVGRGVDFACTVNHRGLDSIAARYKIKRNYETCARNYHWHYSIGGY